MGAQTAQRVAALHAPGRRRRRDSLHQYRAVRHRRDRHAVRERKDRTTFVRTSRFHRTSPTPRRRFFNISIAGALWRSCLAVVAYSGPVIELISHPGFLAPGIRTW